MDDVNTIESATEIVRRTLSNRVNAIHHASRFVKLALISGGSLVVAISQFLQGPEGQSLSTWQWIGIVSAALVAIGGVFVVWTEHDATKELMDASTALDQATSHEREFESRLHELELMFDDFSKYIEIYQSVKLMRDALEAAASDHMSESEICALLIRASQRSLRIAMGFQTEHLATICIYKAEIGQGRAELVCVAHWREIDCEVAGARRWPEGLGVAGICYAKSDFVFVPDVKADGFSSVFAGQGANSRSYDAEQYRSMAAAPILVQGDSKPWGVVVATVNESNHFCVDNDGGLRPDEGVRLLANMVALGVAMGRRWPVGSETEGQKVNG